jgi:hypothetical protein
MISPALRNLLIDSASKGDEKLRQLLISNFDTIDCIAGVTCNKEGAQFTKIHVGIIDWSLAATRGLIDQMTMAADSYARDLHQASAYQDGEGWRNGQSTSWSRSRQHGENSFARTGESADKNFRVARGESRSASYSTVRDEGKRAQNSLSSSHDDTTSNGVGKGTGKSRFSTSRSSAGRSGTNLDPGLGQGMPTPQRGPIEYLPPTTVNTLIFGGPVADQYYAADPSVVADSNAPTDSVDCSTAAVAPVIAPPIAGITVPLDAQAQAYWATCNPFPSMSRSSRVNNRYTWTVSASFSVPVVGFSAQLSWGGEGGFSEAGSFRQSAVCGVSLSTAAGSSNSEQSYKQADAAFSEGQSDAQAFGYVQNKSTSCAGAETKSTSHAHSESKGESKSCGESRSFDARSSHGEGQNFGNAQSQMERHSESEGSHLSRAKAKQETFKYNQIFTQLNELRRKLFDKLLSQENREAASRQAVACAPPPRGLHNRPLMWYARGSKQSFGGVKCR